MDRPADRSPAAPATHGALALSPTPSPARGPALRLVRPGTGVDTELQAVADAAVRLIVEVLAGTRPSHQLSLVATPAVCRRLATRCTPPGGVPNGRGMPGGRRTQSGRELPTGRGSSGGQGGRIVPPKVVSVRLQRPVPGAAEAAAVVVVGGRVHAVALRLEHARGRWRCTAVETTAG